MGQTKEVTERKAGAEAGFAGWSFLSPYGTTPLFPVVGIVG